MSARNDAGTPAPAQRTTAAPGSAPDDAGTPAPAERIAQVQGKAPRTARGATAGTGAALGAAGITGSGASAPGKPTGKGQTGNGG